MTSDQADALIAAINALVAVLQTVFAVPGSDEVAAVFALGFVAPATFFLVAHMVGAMVNFWRH